MPRPLRVLHVNTEPTWRGGEQQLLYLLDGLRARGVPSVLAAQPDGPMTARARARGHDLAPLRMRGEADPLAVLRLHHLLRAGRFTLVHAHTSHAHTLIALAAALFGRGRTRPRVVVARRVDFSIFRRSFFGLNHLKYLHGVDAYITVSEAIRRVLIEDGIPPGRIACVHSGIDLARIEGAPDRRDAIRAELAVPPGHALVANVAHMADHKGQRYLLEALPAILAARRDVVVAIVGDGELRGELEALAARLGVAAHVRFPGFRDDVPSLLKALDVFVMPSHMEGLGTSVLDAMTAGVPVVGTTAGGMPEAIEDGVTGLLCPVRDAAAIAAAVLRLLGDRDLAARLVAGARARVRARFSTDAMVDGTLAAYRRIPAGPQGDGPADPARAGRGAARGVARLLPLFRPHLGAMAALVVASLGYAAADAGRAWLVAPLVNDVLMRGGEVKGQLEDEALAARADPARVASALAVATPAAAELEALRADPALGLGPAEPEDDPAVAAAPTGGCQLRAPGAGPAADDPTRARAALRTTRRALLRVADDPALSRGDAEAWAALARAARLQARAEGLLAADPSVAVAASLEARRLAYGVDFTRARATLGRTLGWALALAVAIAVGHWVTFYQSRRLTAQLYVDLQRRTAEHLLGLSVRFLEGERRGDILARLTTDLALVSNVITSQCDLVVQVIRLVVLAGAAVLVSWQLTLSLLALAGLVILPLRAWGRRQRRASRRRQGAGGDVFEVLQQMLSGIRVVKAFQREAHELRRFEVRLEAATAAQIDALRAREAAKAFMQLVNDLAVPALVLLGGVVVVGRHWDLDPGRLGTFLGLAILMYLPARAVGEAWSSLNDALPSVDRVFELLDARPLVIDAPDAVAAPPVREGLRFEAVSFRYGEGAEALAEVSFDAPAGTLTALVGHSGSGKSTLVDLISRTHDPTAGRVLVDGVDLRRVRLGEWLDRLAVVPQQGFLFDGTIRENIRYGRLDATDAEVEEAARLAGVHDEVVARPAGYDDPVGERGQRLSGGQVQRVALARALVKRPAVLILDEATNKLDARTERLVQQALEAVARRTTTFVVAHRLSTVVKADQILVLERGRIVERGRHEELLARGGQYAELFRTQALDAPAA